MIRNYIKISLRNLQKHRQFSFINIFGLSMALSLVLCMMLYVEDEMSYDRFHPNADRLHRISMKTQVSEKEFHSAWTPPFIAARMVTDVPEVESFATLYKNFKGFSIKKDEEEVAVNDVFYSSPDFFEVFGFKLKYGNPANALTDPDGIVLSEALAGKLFPGESVMGKIIETTDGMKKITGIIDKTDHNSHFHPSIITPLIGHWDIRELASAVNFDAAFYNYVVFSKDSELSEEKLKRLASEYSNAWINADENRKNEFGNKEIEFHLQNVRDIHLGSRLEFEMEANGSKATVQIFLLVSILIVIVASINYTNLASARYLQRIKELGIRKVLGSGRMQLAVQYFFESLIITLLSAAVAILIILFALPLFNALAERTFSVAQLFRSDILFGLAAIVIACTVLSSLYPALYISNIKAISIFHVNSSGIGKGNRFRKTMLVFQVATSGILLIFTFVLVHQLRFMQHYDLGFQKDQVMVVEVKARDARAKIPMLKEELFKLSEVRTVGLTGQIPGDENLKTEPFAFESNEGTMTELLTNYMFSGPDIVSSLGLSVIAGSNFNPEKGGANRGQEVLVNQTMVQSMNWKDPVGKKVNLPIGEARVVGVVNDFHLKSLHHKIEPLTIIYLDNWAEALLVKVSPDNLSETIHTIEKTYDKVITDSTFEYSFLDDRFDRQYKSDQRQARLFFIFSVITVIIAGMGLMGLIGFSLVRRAKEISIRRVFGADFSRILFLLLREYGYITSVGLLISIPIANYVIKEWLMNFPYKVDLSVAYFAIPVFGMVLFTSLIIYFRCYSTIRANPADVLKEE
jgi:putative ABC transport system permease protein